MTYNFNTLFFVLKKSGMKSSNMFKIQKCINATR